MLFTLIIAKALYRIKERSLTLLENLFLHVSHLNGLVCCHLVHNKKYDACCIVMVSKIWCYLSMLLLPMMRKKPRRLFAFYYAPNC
jgi:hypothetical protein